MAELPFAGLSFLSAGHSNRPFSALADLLRGAGATAVADVRSVPRSTRHPWFDGDALAVGLRAEGIAYAFLGRELGGRPTRPALYRDGVADYPAMAREPAFAKGLARLKAGAATHRIALVCSEGDPVECHRCLLVGRALRRGGAEIDHLRHDAGPLGQAEVEEALMARAGVSPQDLFASTEERLAIAYAGQAGRVAFARRARTRGGAASP